MYLLGFDFSPDAIVAASGTGVRMKTEEALLLIAALRIARDRYQVDIDALSGRLREKYDALKEATLHPALPPEYKPGHAREDAINEALGLDRPEKLRPHVEALTDAMRQGY